MYIEPNTTIKLLRNVPLDNTYEHTIYFPSAATQAAYFGIKAKYTLSNQTYQRVQRGRMRVQYKADDLYDCNYLMFQNTSYGSKWFYAFINSVEYVNNITSEIEFEIDVMQTWFFDYELGMCYVEREHAATDVAGDNTVPENLELGEYITNTFEGTGVLNGTSIVVAATFDETFKDIGGSYYGGLFAGVMYHTFLNNSDGAQACAEFIEGATQANKADGIVAIFLMASNMVTQLLEPARTYTVSKSKLTSGPIDGYQPHNNKLYTYPYNFLYVTNLQGNAAAYPYEYFNSAYCSFVVAGDMTPNPNVVLAPTMYKGAATNYDEKLVLSGYPQLSFNIDTFKAWLAQNASSLAVNALSSATSAQMNAVNAANPAAQSMAAVSGALNLISIPQQVYEHAIMPNQARGGAGSQTLASLGLLDFAFMQKHVRAEYARIIDEYFDVVGYATHRVKVPNRNVRLHWTYTKTASCVIDGSVPADDSRKIVAIYNNGITFWRNGEEVGNYSLLNPPG